MNYILDFNNQMTDQEITEYALDNNITLLKQFDAFEKVYLASCDVEPSVNESLISCINDDHSTLDLLSFQVDLVQETTTYTTVDIESDDNWWKVASIANIDFDQRLYQHPLNGNKCSVYILDSGIEIGHSEFQSSNIQLLHSFTNEFADNNGHGTALASVITGSTCGLTNTNLKIVKIFDNSVPTKQSDLLSAFNAVYNDYVANGKTPAIINLSWTIPYNQYINDKIQYLIDSGVYVICSAGNSGAAIEDVTPACIPDVITVGSYDTALMPSNFSNYTDSSLISFTANETNFGALDGWAPGERIKSAGLNNTYGYSAGTSISSAIASSVLAYNTALYLNNNSEDIVNQADSWWKTNPKIETIKKSLFRRTGVLELTGKYSNSVNAMATYVSAGKIVNSVNLYKAQAGSKYIMLYSPPAYYSSLSTENEIPDYITISNNGYITIEHPEINEPYVIVPDLNFVITGIDGEVINNKVKVIIYSQDKTYAEVVDTVATDDSDPLMNILLESTCANPPCTGTCDGGKTCTETKEQCSCL